MVFRTNSIPDLKMHSQELYEGRHLAMIGPLGAGAGSSRWFCPHVPPAPRMKGGDDISRDETAMLTLHVPL